MRFSIALYSGQHDTGRVSCVPHQVARTRDQQSPDLSTERCRTNERSTERSVRCHRRRCTVRDGCSFGGLVTVVRASDRRRSGVGPGYRAPAANAELAPATGTVAITDHTQTHMDKQHRSWRACDLSGRRRPHPRRSHLSAHCALQKPASTQWCEPGNDSPCSAELPDVGDRGTQITGGSRRQPRGPFLIGASERFPPRRTGRSETTSAAAGQSPKTDSYRPRWRRSLLTIEYVLQVITGADQARARPAVPGDRRRPVVRRGPP